MTEDARKLEGTPNLHKAMTSFCLRPLGLRPSVRAGLDAPALSRPLTPPERRTVAVVVWTPKLALYGLIGACVIVLVAFLPAAWDRREEAVLIGWPMMIVTLASIWYSCRRFTEGRSAGGVMTVTGRPTAYYVSSNDAAPVPNNRSSHGLDLDGDRIGPAYVHLPHRWVPAWEASGRVEAEVVPLTGTSQSACVVVAMRGLPNGKPAPGRFTGALSVTAEAECGVRFGGAPIIVIAFGSALFHTAYLILKVQSDFGDDERWALSAVVGMGAAMVLAALAAIWDWWCFVRTYEDVRRRIGRWTVGGAAMVSLALAAFWYWVGMTWWAAAMSMMGIAPWAVAGLSVAGLERRALPHRMDLYDGWEA